MLYYRFIVVAFLLAVTVNSTLFAQADYEWIVEPTYFKVENFSNGYGRGMLHGLRYSVVDKNGQKIQGLKSIPSQNRYFKGQKGQYLLTNTQLEPISPALYDEYTRFTEGISIVRQGVNIFGIDTLGRELFKINIGKSVDFYPFQNDRTVFRDGHLGSDLWGFMSRSGQVLCKAKYRYISSFSDGVAAFKAGNYWGILDKNGGIRLAAKYDWISEFSEGVAVVRQNNRHGFINTNGVVVIPIQYRHAQNFSEGLAAVQNNDGLWGFIDQNNQYVIHPQFAFAYSFHEGLASVENSDGKYGLIDQSGKLIIPYTFEDTRDVADSRMPAKLNGKWGYIKLTNPSVHKKEKRKLKAGKAVVVTVNTVELQVFDYEQEDGDSISLFFNGKPILEHYRLTKIPKKINIQLAENKMNQLVLHAHNLGAKSPNTASIKIISGQQSQTVEMVANLAESDRLYFFKDPKNISGKMTYSFLSKNPENPSYNQTILFKNQFLRFDSKTEHVLMDNENKKGYLCKTKKEAKIAYSIPYAEKGTVTFLKGKYLVMGYVCHKARVLINDIETMVYYTMDLPFTYSLFAGIPGVPLQFTKGAETYKAISLSFEPLDEGLFSLEGYEFSQEDY